MAKKEQPVTGFFDVTSLPVAAEEGKHTSSSKLSSCKGCGLYHKCDHPKIQHIGEGKARILVIGDPVSKAIDKDGIIRGSHLSELRSTFRSSGFDFNEDCWYTPALKCYGSQYTSTSFSACHRKLIEEIKELKPSVIVATCQEAWDVLLIDRMGGRAENTAFYQWCGEQIPDQVLNTWICPIISPEQVLKFEEKSYNSFHFFQKKQISAIKDIINKPVKKYEFNVVSCSTVEKAIDAIEVAMDWKLFAFDYETTGIKPYRPGHEILAASISDGKISYAFPFFKDERFRNAWKKLMLNPAKKIAHNASFERMWTETICGHPVANLCHDPMLLQHVRNNQKPTSLKFLTYSFFGILGYDAEVDPYIGAPSEIERRDGSNAMNRLKEFPVGKLLYYNALDSLFTVWIWDKMLDEIDIDHQLPGYKFFMEVQYAFYKAHKKGIVLDRERLDKTNAQLSADMDVLFEKVIADPEIDRLWDMPKRFNPRSDQDLRRLLYTHMGFKPTAFTDKGLPSVDVDALETMRSEVSFLQPLYTYKKLYKTVNTYFRQYTAEEANGVLNSFYTLHKVKTYRSSCNSPNLQNVSKRDKDAKRYVRQNLRPHPHQRIIEYDFKAMEVSIAATISRDPALIRYVSDPSKDMHLDCASSMFFLDTKDVPKPLRNNATKGPFVFAAFYGSYYKLMAAGIWAEIDIPDVEKVYGFDVIKHLKKNGIKNYEKWENHVQEQERILWEERFPVYQDFRNATFDIFKKQGYIDYPNGFRYYGPASRNEVLNSTVQGPAFHIQAWAFTEITKIMEKKNMASAFIGQVHDSMVASVDPMEESYLDNLVYEYATQKVKEHWDWITVPLMVEKERSEVDGDWATMSACGYLSGGA